MVTHSYCHYYYYYYTTATARHYLSHLAAAAATPRAVPVAQGGCVFAALLGATVATRATLAARAIRVALAQNSRERKRRRAAARGAALEAGGAREERQLRKRGGDSVLVASVAEAANQREGGVHSDGVGLLRARWPGDAHLPAATAERREREQPLGARAQCRVGEELF